MKKQILLPFLVSMAVLLGVQSCGEEESFHQITQIEREVYLKINEYRSSNGLGSLVEQFLLFKEARIVSERIAANEYELDDPEAEQDLNEMADNLGGTSHFLMTFPIEAENADIIVDYMIATQAYSEAMLGEYSQCGVGFATDNEGNHYVTVMLVEIPD
jgi:uncharacterized protein YkwD